VVLTSVDEIEIRKVAHPYFYDVALLYGPLTEHLRKVR
jgi:hypothetical protein